MISARDEALAKTLGRWGPNLKTVEPVDLPEAEILARKYKAEGIVLGWTLNDFEFNKVQIEDLALPVFYPLIGMSRSKIDELLKYIMS